MFATRGNNENAIYEQQTAAASKPLNAGLKGLAPKTPGQKAAKTPLRRPVNDENAKFGGGKTGGKGKQDVVGETKLEKVEKSAFVTPAGPRTRAPLGNKTTNAKAGALQTPAPPTQEKLSAKPTSPRLRRAKVKIHQPDPLDAEAQEEEREIEYMPPREVPLPDYPDDWPHDRTYPQFQGNNLTRGWWSEFAPQREDESEDDSTEFQERLRKVTEKERQDNEREQAKKKAVVAKAPSTLKSRSAASALTSSVRATKTPSSAAPTAATKARLPSAFGTKQQPNTNTNSGNARHTAAKAASNTTLGYSKGRAVSASARAPLTDIYHRPAPGGKGVNETKSANRATLDALLGLRITSADNEEEDELGLGFSGSADPLAVVLEELEDFQLPPVEL